MVADRAASLRKLKDHPSWITLREEWDAQKKQHMERLATQLLAGGPTGPPVNQREIDYRRGFIHGAELILNNPDKIESTLEALREQSRR